MKTINHIEQYSSLIRYETLNRYQRWRLIKDNIAEKGVVLGGLSVIVAIALIFFYLLYVVQPLFESANSESIAQYNVPEVALGKTLLLAMEEQNEIAVRFTDQGKAIFFEIATGKTILIESIAIPNGAEIVSFAQGNPATGVVVYGLADGRAIIAKHQYKVSYPNDVRLISPVIEYPLGRVPLVIDHLGNPLQKIAVRVDEYQTTLAAKTTENKLLINSYTKEESLFGEESNREQTEANVGSILVDAEYILIDKEQRFLYLASKAGHLSIYNIADKLNPVLIQHLPVIKNGQKITSMEFLNAEISLLIGDNNGLLSQWSECSI